MGVDQERADGSNMADNPFELEGMEKELEMLYAVARCPTVSRAWIIGESDSHEVMVEFTQRDLETNTRSTSISSWRIPPSVAEGGGSDRVVTRTPSLPICGKAPLQLSPSGERGVRFWTENGAAMVEVWRHGTVSLQLAVSEKLHGAVFQEGWFGLGPAWNADENRIAYVAEAPAPKPPMVGLPRGTNGSAAAEASRSSVPPAPAPKGFKSTPSLLEDWGERYPGQRQPCVFVMDLDSGEVTAVSGAADELKGYSCGQPTWTPDGQGLVFVAWPHAPSNFPQLRRRLGVVYCMNRPCRLVHCACPPGGSAATAPPQPLFLTSKHGSAASPKFSPDGTRLLFLSHQPAVDSGAHQATVKLLELRWEGSGAEAAASADARVVVDAVQTAADASAFPGLYLIALSDCSFRDSRRLLLTTQWRSDLAVVAVDLDSGNVSRLTPPGTSWTMLAARKELVVVNETAPNQPFKPLLGVLTPDGSSVQRWVELVRAGGSSSVPELLASRLTGLRTDTLPFEKDGVPFEAVVVRSGGNGGNGGDPGPAVLVLHGGPHSCFPTTFLLGPAFLAALGYTLIFPNYRGSTGFGEASIQSLPGHVGTNDVADCMDCLDAAIARGWARTDNVAVAGGSHGGFLTGHLLGQHPSRFTSGVLRNPVLNLPVMVHLTDISDWCFVEVFGAQDGKQRVKGVPTLEELQAMHEKSPIRFINDVKAPMLFLLGAKDRRVEHHDALHYAAALQDRTDGPQAKVLVFPEDNHALDVVRTEYEQNLHAAHWLKTHSKWP